MNSGTGFFKGIIGFVRDESGATAIEFGLIAALIAIAAVLALTDLGSAFAAMFDSNASTTTHTASL